MNIIKNSRLFVLLFFSVFFYSDAVFAQAPDFAWAKQAGGIIHDFGFGIAVDGSGNSYVTGVFRVSATFGSTTLNSSGDADVFIAKYDASGNVLWARSAGGTSDDTGFGIAVDVNGNSYVTGFYVNSATFGSTTLNSSGDGDVFIAKYDASGNVLWARSAGGTDGDSGFGIAVDVSGNSYVTGSFRSSATFGSTTLTSSGGDDVFIAKYDAAGTVLWARKAGGTDWDKGNCITVDGSGNSYVTGRFRGSATFGSSTLTSIGGYDVFIAKYDATGNVLWARSAGGTSNDYGGGIAIDGSGNSYVTGSFEGSAIFGSTTFISSGGADVFIAKLDAAGNVLWARSAGGTSSDYGTSIAVDGSGNSYFTGDFSDSATFGSTTLTSSGNADMFTAKYDASGNALWVRRGGGSGSDSGNGIAVDGSGNSYVTGYFWGSATFGSTTLTSNNSFDIFLAKLGNNPLSLPEPSTATLSTYPNPFTTNITISLPGNSPATATLTDVLGREVHRQAITAETGGTEADITPPDNLPAGVYLLRLNQGNTVQQVRVVRQ